MDISEAFSIISQSSIGKFVNQNVNGCWDWSGRRFQNGYCYIPYDGRLRSAAAVIREICGIPLPPKTKLYGTCESLSCVSPDHRITQHEFFQKLVVPVTSGCHEWTGSINPNGYGRIWIHGKEWLSHRLAWTIKNGEIPYGMVVRHKVCNNPKCCNTDHLLLGTNEDNVRDRVESGRSAEGDTSGARTCPDSIPRGQNHGMADLNDSQVIEIRESYASGESSVSLSEKFNINRAHITQIVSGRSWACIPISPDLKERIESAKEAADKSRITFGERHYKTKLTNEIVVEIRKAFAEAVETTKEIGARFGIQGCTVCDISSGKSWKSAGGPITKNRPRPKNSSFAKGSRQGSSKITEEIVRDIRDSYLSKRENQTQISARTGLHQTTVSDIIRRKSWAHVS